MVYNVCRPGFLLPLQKLSILWHPYLGMVHVSYLPVVSYPMFVYVVIPIPDIVLVAAVLVIVSSQIPKSLLLAGITVLLVAVVFPDFYVTFHIPIRSRYVTDPV